MERFVSAAYPSSYAPGFHPVLRQKHPPLYHLPLLWEPGFFLLQRIHRPGNAIPHGQFRHLHQGEYPQVSFPVLQKRPDPHQLRPDPLRVLRVLHPGQYHLHLEIHPAGVPRLLSGPV